MQYVGPTWWRMHDKFKQKQVRQQDAYLAIRPAYPRGCCPRAAKGDKTYLQPVFLHTGNFWRWSAHVSPRYRLQTTELRKKQNCTSYVLAHRVYVSGKIRRYKWHSRTGEKPAFISGIHCVPRFSVVSEIQGSKHQKLSKKFKLQNCTSEALIHPVDSWGKIRQYKWHSCTGEIPTFICGTPYVPIFFVVSEIQGSKLQKLSKKYKFSYFWATV